VPHTTRKERTQRSGLIERARRLLGDSRETRLRTLGLFAFFFLVIAAFWVQKPIRTSRFLTDVGPRLVPVVKLGSAILVLPIVLIYSSLAARYRRDSLVLVCVVVFSAGSLLFWYLFSSQATEGSAPVAYAYFFYLDIFNSVMVALFWSLANDLNPPDDARRTYGIIGAGGIVGGTVGSAVTGWSVEHLGAPNLLLVCVACLVAIALIARLLSRAHGDGRAAAAKPPAAMLREAIAGARLTVASRYLTAIALVVVAYEIVSNVIDYQFNTVVAARYTDDAAMAGFLGRFSTASNAASLVMQVVATTWILRQWGPRVGLLVLPVVLGLGSLGFVVIPVFAMAAATFFSDAALAYSLNQSAKEVLYTPTDAATKYQAKAFIDMFLMRLAKGISSLLILACMAWWLPGQTAVHWLGVISVAVVIGWVAVAHAAARSFSRQTQGGARSSTRARDAARAPSRGTQPAPAGGVRS
jgi:AAA family ATP:ADP antiporter